VIWAILYPKYCPGKPEIALGLEERKFHGQTSLNFQTEFFGPFICPIIPVESVPSITQETAKSSSQALRKNNCQQLAKAVV
jgi:hypothetical protein